MFCSYDQNFEGTPVLGDQLVVTYNAGQVKNAYGTAQMLSAAKDGHPCKNVTMKKEDAIQLAKDADAKKNGKGNFSVKIILWGKSCRTCISIFTCAYAMFLSKGNNYTDIESTMAINEKMCVFEVRFFVPDVPALMHILVNAKTKNIELIENQLRSFPGTPLAKDNTVEDEEKSRDDDLEDDPESLDMERAGTKFIFYQCMWD